MEPLIGGGAAAPEGAELIKDSDTAGFAAAVWGLTATGAIGAGSRVLVDRATYVSHYLALLQLAAYTGKSDYYQQAADALSGMQSATERYPTAFAQWLQAMQFALAEGREIAILGEPDAADTQDLLKVLWDQYRPFDLAAVAAPPVAAGAPELFESRELREGKATAYVCRNFVCELPVNTAEELSQRLGAK